MNRKILLIDSSKASLSTSNTDFKVILQQPIPVQACKLESFNIPLTWNNITTSNYNYTVVVASTTYNRTLPVGRYTNIADVLTAIENDLISVTGFNFSLTQNSITGKITIEIIGGATNFNITFASGKIWDILGCNSGQTLTGQPSYTFSYVPKFYSLDKYFLLKIEYLDGGIEHINNLQDSTTFVIQLPNLIGKSFGEMIEWNTQNDLKVIDFSGTVQLQSFSVALYRDDNTSLDLQNNQFYFQLRILE